MKDESLTSVYHISEAANAEARKIIQLLDVVVEICTGKLAADAVDAEKHREMLEEAQKSRKSTFALLSSLAQLTLLAENE